jgi:hypothetical protein
VPEVAGYNLLISPDPNHFSGLQLTQRSNSNVLPGTGSIVYAPSVSGTIHSKPCQETLVIPTASLRTIETNGGAQVAIETRSYLTSHTKAAYSIADGRLIGIQSLGRSDENSTNVHNHIFQFWPTTYIVRTVETNKPVAPSESSHFQPVFQLQFSKSPFSHTERNGSASSTSDTFKIAKIENAKSTKILPITGISHMEILNSNALFDALDASEALNQVPHVDSRFKHTTVSNSKYRDDEYQTYRPKNDLCLKYLHYKHAPYIKDRSLEALDESHEARQVYTANYF